MKKMNLRHAGFVLIEAMTALLIIAFGLVALSRLQVLSLTGASDAKARSEAMAYSQRKLEAVRNLVTKGQFTGTPQNGTWQGQYALYTLNWSVSTPSGEQRVARVTTSWTDSQGGSQRIDLNTVIAWDDPSLQAANSKGLGGSLISPTGEAQRADRTIAGHSGVYTDPQNYTYLLDSAGKVLLYLAPKNGVAQSFTTITGKVFFDQNAGNNKIPASANVRVRLSSEGECIYNNADANMTAVTSGTYSYKYFVYTCYVGPGWYGNVGVLVDDSVNGAAGDPAVCVGDPSFTNDGTLISAHAFGSPTRSYRGFKGSTGSYLSTGMAGGSAYGLSYGSGGAALTGPFAGSPRPSSYPSTYTGVTAGSANDYFEQNFLITAVNCNSSTMAASVFARNAGKYFCISPDNDSSSADACPSIWPNFESQVSSGGGSGGSGGSGGTCTTTISGAAHDKQGTVSLTTPTTGGSCAMDGGGVKTYTCTLSLATGTSFTLTNAKTNGNAASQYSYTQSNTANCSPLVINFP